MVCDSKINSINDLREKSLSKKWSKDVKKTFTKELDKLIYEIAAAFTGSHHDYSRLASSVAISSYHKETNESFSETMNLLHGHGIINEILIDTLTHVKIYH